MSLREFLASATAHGVEHQRDILGRNDDLVARAGELLAGLPVRRLDAVVAPAVDGHAHATVTTQGFTRLDVFVDDRPQHSLDVADGTLQIDLRCGPQSAVELVGRDYGAVVARRTLRCGA